MKIKHLPNGHGLPLPKYQTKGAAGLDLHAAEDVIMHPGERALIQTGIAVEIPPGHVGLLCPRSGLAYNHKLTVLNAPGVIDQDFRGEIKVMLINHSFNTQKIEFGERIGQLLIMPIVRVELELCDELVETERGEAGFGSTGVK